MAGSAVDATKPISGTPTTQSVRDQFSTIKDELNNLLDLETIATSGTLVIYHNYLVTNNGTFTLPSTTGLVAGDKLSVTGADAVTTGATINRDGGNSEDIIRTDTGATDTSFLLDLSGIQITFVYNGTDWEV